MRRSFGRAAAGAGDSLIILALFLTAAIVVSSTARASGDTATAKAETKVVPTEMVTNYLCLLTHGPQWPPRYDRGGEQIRSGHREYLSRLENNGHILMAGPCEGSDSLSEVLVIAADSLPGAVTLMNDDPAVQAGWYTPTVHPWWRGKGLINLPTQPETTETFYFGMLCKAPAWTPGGDSVKMQKLQDAHLAHLREQFFAGNLLIAGPLMDDNFIRGIAIYKTPSLQRAQELADADPAVRAGRLKVYFHAWKIPKGILR